MFQSARLKLTVWYLLIIMLISIMFSATIYRLITNELEGEFYRITDRYEHAFGATPPAVEQGETMLKESESRVVYSLLYVNLIILAVAGVGGYILAGITLRPIKTMIDEQNRFIQDASHELKTPLTSLRSEIEVYLRAKNHSQHESMTLLASNLEEVNKLQHLSDNLIQLAQYPKSQKNLFEKVSFQKVLQQALATIQKTAKQKNITLKTLQKDIAILGDTDQLIQLFTILFDNAIKYSPEKSTITVSFKKVDGTVTIYLADKGIGIDKNALPHIFDRFYRADASRTKQAVPGYGLGLAIAKAIVAAHNGTIAVTSTLGKGSTFIITLPQA